jgi:cytolysin (calcineurin-like family phosphatase)
MSKSRLLALALLLAIPAAAHAEAMGSVTKALRPQLRTFDDKGQPLGQLSADELKLPQPIVGYGVGNSIGVKHGAGVVYLRGLDVQTDGAKAACTAVAAAARPSGSAYAASNMGLGGAADCKRPTP